MTVQDRFWIDYYSNVCEDGPGWVDYSNERVHVQTLGTVLEASDRLVGRSVLDVGCGRGQLCRIAQAMGAANVTGIDLPEEPVNRLTNRYPDIRWLAGDFADEALRKKLATYDVVFLVEVLQFLPIPDAFKWVWDILRPGGRIIATFPYEGCPIVGKTVARFEGRYAPPPLSSVARWADEVAPDAWSFRGIRFQENQSLAPYEVLPWTKQADWNAPPNRIQLVVQRSHE